MIGWGRRIKKEVLRLLSVGRVLSIGAARAVTAKTTAVLSAMTVEGAVFVVSIYTTD